jgi:hypothetical protein
MKRKAAGAGDEDASKKKQSVRRKECQRGMKTLRLKLDFASLFLVEIRLRLRRLKGVEFFLCRFARTE